MGTRPRPEIDPQRFAVHRTTVRGFEQAFVYERARGSESAGALLCVHGWPESKRIFWKVIEPLAAAGFDVIVPDLRGFGDSGPAPDGFYDTPSHARDLYALVHDHLGYESCAVLGGDLGGPVIQEMALRWPEFVSRMALFNSPLPFDKERMAGIEGTRAPRESADYFIRQGTDADALAAELSTPEARRHYIATFYSSRFWAHPGTFAPDEVDFHTEPFASADVLRASFGGYESVFDPAKRSEVPMMGRNEVTPTVVLFGPSDHVIYPAFDKMAAQVFGKCVGPFLLRDCGHFVPWESPSALVSATVAFAR
ncbi:MAG: alpha/beta hydrolase [Actinomycetota bacterium]|nr:alpha/beta hydrolase [Actinomycetota bacterium]MDA3001784.1 alpha/beta hydrolase [Actinomycetota bacterium]